MFPYAYQNVFCVPIQITVNVLKLLILQMNKLSSAYLKNMYILIILLAIIMIIAGTSYLRIPLKSAPIPFKAIVIIVAMIILVWVIEESCD
jgi:hypothetical protein